MNYDDDLLAGGYLNLLKEIISCLSVSVVLQWMVYDAVHIGRDCNIYLER